MPFQLRSVKVKKEVGINIIVPIKGLEYGVHTYMYTLKQPFFDSFGSLDIRDASIETIVKLEKQTSGMLLHVVLQGSVLRSCDRCLGDLLIPVTYSAHVVVKFAKRHEEEQSEEWILADPNDTEIDLTQYVYDSVCVNLPLQSIHPTGQCDPEMERRIAELIVN